MVISNPKSFFEFLELCSQYSSRTIYRGVSSDKHKLVPSIGRDLLKKDNKTPMDEKEEELIFKFFKQRSKPFIREPLDDMSLLAIARHHGLPTRLLDWTFNPLAAVFFAVERSLIQPVEIEKKVECSVIYVFQRKNEIRLLKTYKGIKVNKLEFFIPAHIHERIINQNGLFSIHPFPWDELTDPNIEIIKIDLDFRRKLRLILNRLGVNEGMMYPGLDGIASYIRWGRTNYY